MTTQLPSAPARLSDGDLMAAVKRLARCERDATAQLIAHLAELDARRLYLGAGFASLFVYCTGALRLSEAEAYNRIEAARAARGFPVILDRLREGSLNLTTVRLWRPTSRAGTTRSSGGRIGRAGARSELLAGRSRARRYRRRSSAERQSAGSAAARCLADGETRPLRPPGRAATPPPASPVPPAPALLPPRRVVVASLAPDQYEITAGRGHMPEAAAGAGPPQTPDPGRRPRRDLRPRLVGAAPGVGQEEARGQQTSSAEPGHGSRLAPHPGAGQARCPAA
jgi:hypothetical protein